MEPALPAGMHLEWAPPSPAQFAEGQRGFACLFNQSTPGTFRYASVFTAAFPPRRSRRRFRPVIGPPSAPGEGGFPGRIHPV